MPVDRRYLGRDQPDAVDQLVERVGFCGQRQVIALGDPAIVGRVEIEIDRILAGDG
jgi:hypothetical protein